MRPQERIRQQKNRQYKKKETEVSLRLTNFVLHMYKHLISTQRWGIVINLCLSIDVAEAEDEEFGVVDTVEFSPERLDF